MASLGTVTFTGASGNNYEFNVYTWGTAFKKNYGAVYFVTRRSPNANDGYSHTWIYVGQTGDLSTRFNDHHKQDCFGRYNKNGVCVHGEQNEERRLKIEQDLIDNYHPPCNAEG